MGDVTEMVLIGLLCQACGAAFIDNGETGCPRSCVDCKPKKKKRKLSCTQWMEAKPMDYKIEQNKWRTWSIYKFNRKGFWGICGCRPTPEAAEKYIIEHRARKND